MSNYKSIVQQIADLDWSSAKMGDIILLSLSTAKEFAASLRLGEKLYPKDARLKEMMEGELKTNNMTFEDYTKKGDHWEFLDHFIIKYNIHPSSPAITNAADRYTHALEDFSDADRAMTVFSREEELTLIFGKILTAHNWDKAGYGFYKYYLERDIMFDLGDKGHAWLTQHFPMHPDILEKFYLIRLEMYRSLFV